MARQDVETGTIVRIVAPGSRESEGEARTIPAVVLQQWPDGSLQLYCLHFQGSPLLVNAARAEDVEVVLSPSQLNALTQRLVELENQMSVLKPGWKHNELKFAIDR